MAYDEGNTEPVPRSEELVPPEDKDYSEAMLAFTLSLSTATSLDSVFKVCVQTALCVARMEWGAVYLATEATQTLKLAEHQGLPTGFLETNSSFTYESPLVQRVLAGEVVDASTLTALEVGDQVYPLMRFNSLLVLPMHYRHRVIGCLLVGSSQNIRPSPGRIRWLKTIATLMSCATVRFRMESMLGESEKKYQRLILNVPGVVFQFVWHRNGGYTFPFISASAREMFGLEPGKVMSNENTPYSLMHPEDLALLDQGVKESAETMRPFRMEMRHLVDDQIRWCDCHSRPEVQPNGDILWDGVMMDITDRKKMEKELEEAYNELEQRVRERTAELDEINQQLRFELGERKRMEKILCRRESQLQTQAKGLEEVNTALKVLLRRREEDKVDLERNLQANIEQLVLPFLEKIKGGHLSEQQATYLSLLESTLQDIVSPFLNNLTYKSPRLTPTEIRVAQLVREGMTTKEIGQVLSLSPRTIETHRKKIRRKLGLDVVKGNLRSHLLTYQ